MRLSCVEEKKLSRKKILEVIRKAVSNQFFCRGSDGPAK
jgi:hypothetical protein